MAKGVLVHRVDTAYDDLPEARYQFPRTYLNKAYSFEGDWIVYYEPRRGGGRLGYNSIAKIQEIIPDPSLENMFLAIIEPGTYLPFEEFVPFRSLAGFLESGLEKRAGTLNRGLAQRAVRSISDQDFYRIVSRGFPEAISTLPRLGEGDPIKIPLGMNEDTEPFVFDYERERVELTITRKVRDRAFRREVINAYDCRCALTGLKFINGGGRAEVEAAHIRSVEHGGPDTVRNGLALSGTIHWMFDRGLISLSDKYEIMVSRQVNNPDDVWQLMNTDRKATIPAISHQRPHPRYLEWHREQCFKH